MKAAGISAEDAVAALQPDRDHSRLHRASHRGGPADRSAQAPAHRANNSNVSTASRLPTEDAEDCEDNIRAEVTSLWQTDEVRLAKPTVDDEIRMGLRYFRLSLFDALPKIYAEVVESFRDVYGLDLDANRLAQPGATSAPGLAETATATRWSNPIAFATRWTWRAR